MTNNQQTTNDIGVRVVRWGQTLEGVLINIDYDHRTAHVESWRHIGDGRYCWLDSDYRLDEVTLDCDVVRPCQIYDSFDFARMRDDGSEREAQAERFEHLEYWLNGYGWGLR